MRPLLGNLRGQGPAGLKDKATVLKSFMIKRERMNISLSAINFRNFRSHNKQISRKQDKINNK